jgi:hypothetical protein
MTNLQRRMESLEEAMDRRDAQVAWPEVGAALRRQQARVRLKVCRRLGLDPDDCCVREAAALLIDDTAELTAQDAAMVQRWCRQEGIVTEHRGVRQRLMQKFDAIARRLKGPDRRGTGAPGVKTVDVWGEDDL